jgi:beta-lactamase regulating signal transducer with metallopeptidase domain
MNISHMSVSAGLLITAIVIIRAAALNRLPKTTFLVLWGVALCRLLIPVSIPLRYSVYDIIDRIVKSALPDAAAQPAITIALSAGGPAAGTTGTPGVTGQIAPAAVVWLAGMLAVFAAFAVIYFKNHRELRFALIVRGNDFLNQWLAEHRLPRPITILQSDRITTPVAVGLLKPRVILPKSVNMNDKRLLSYVLTHEYYHIKRCDALWINYFRKSLR